MSTKGQGFDKWSGECDNERDGISGGGQKGHKALCLSLIVNKLGDDGIHFGWHLTQNRVVGKT